MLNISNTEYEVASKIVVAVIQSGKMPSYDADKVFAYYSEIYHGIRQLVKEDHERAQSRVDLPTVGL